MTKKVAKPTKEAKKRAKGLPKPRMISWRKALGLQHRFDKAMRKAVTQRNAIVADKEVVQDIFNGLGETSLRADHPYVTTALENAAVVEGPVVQCGANPLTLLLAIIMQHRAEYLWTLEHNPSWAQMLGNVLKRYDIRAGQLIQAPAEAFGDHIWYVVDTKTLPRNIELILCDGSNVLPNGMRGVVRRLQNHLSPRCQLLVRNTVRPKDLDFASKWAKEQGAPFILNDKCEPFVKIALRDRKADDLAEDRELTVYDKVAEAENIRLTPTTVAAQRKPAQKVRRKRIA